MKKNYRIAFLLAAITSMAIISCKKTNDDTVFTSYREYSNLQPGKYIIYRLDSTITRSFGSSFVVASYIVKDSVAEEITDNLNRPAFKVYRFYWNATHTAWNPVNTFTYTPAQNSLEYYENNLRYLKLVDPIENDKSWLGNSYVGQPVFHQNSFFQTWEFYYKEVGEPKRIGNLDFANTVTVVQYDSTQNNPFSPYAFSTYDKGYEIYADSVGLVYRDVMSWEYQPSINIGNCVHTYPNPNGTGTVSASINCDSPNANCDSLNALANHRVQCDTTLTSYFYNGFGVKQTILSHN